MKLHTAREREINDIFSPAGSAGTCMCFSPCQDWDEWCYGTFAYDPNVQPMDDGKGVLINYNKAGTLGTRYIILSVYDAFSSRN
jgi:hypothetical protein